MYEIDQEMPGSFRLLIRARTTSDVDSLLASVVVARVASVASVEGIRHVAEAAERARGDGSTEPATAEQKLVALSAVAEFEDWYCGTVPRWPWPHRRDLLDTVSDPAVSVVAEGARTLVQAGSPGLQKTLGEALERL